MRKTIYKLCRAGLVWLVPAALLSCQHKELCYDHSHVVEVKVNFDWSECPDAAPRTMVLQLFTPDGSHCNRYEFGSPKGGVIRVQAGSYRMLFHNGDMENVVERGTCYDDYEVTTAARALLAVFGSEMPADIRALSASSNTAALLSAGLRGLSGLKWELAEPLYDELLGQIYRVPNPGKPDDVIRLTPQNLDAHVEDVGTIYRLRWEAIAVCLDFLQGGEGLTSRLSQILNPLGFGTTQTSPDASASR